MAGIVGAIDRGDDARAAQPSFFMRTIWSILRTCEIPARFGPLPVSHVAVPGLQEVEQRAWFVRIQRQLLQAKG